MESKKLIRIIVPKNSFGITHNHGIPIGTKIDCPLCKAGLKVKQMRRAR